MKLLFPLVLFSVVSELIAETVPRTQRGGDLAAFTLTDTWVESESTTYNYKIFVRQRFAHDLPLVHKWIDYVYAVAITEYGIVPGELHVYLCEPGDHIKGVPPIWGSGAGYYNDDDVPVPLIAMATPSLRPIQGCCDIIRMPFRRAGRADLIVHEAFHHVQSQVLGDRYLVPNWFFEGGAKLAEWKAREDQDEILEYLLEAFAIETSHGFRLGDLVCCWSLSQHMAPSFNNDYFPPWLFMTFAEEHCGDDFYRDILLTTTEETPFQEAWASEVESCGETVPSLFREFQEWFQRHRPEVSIERIPTGKTVEPPLRRTPTRTRRR